jgi:hypothetical protein
MPKISETLSLAGGNLSRPTRFTAMIAPPSEVIGDATSKTFDVLCKTVGVPDTQMETIDINLKGHTVKIPGRVQQDQTIELTIYLDENHYLRTMFYNWMTGMDNRFPAHSGAASANLVHSRNWYGNLIIKARDFNETTNEVMNYLIEGVYPTAVSGVEYSSAGISEVHEFTVTLTYLRFLSGDTSGQYDDIDNFLDKFGQSAQSYSLGDFGGLGQVSDLYNKAKTAYGAVTGAFSSISNLF